MPVKAAILHGKENIQIEDVSPPALKPGEVRVRIESALTCGTDLKVFKRGYHAKMIVPPAVFGHELAGVISELGDGSLKSGWKIGDRVVPANSAPCGNCFHCGVGQENICDDLQFLNGAYAESIVVPARLVQKNLLRLKPETDFADASLTEPLACVVQGVDDTKLRAGQHVLVIGAGPIGLMFTALAKKSWLRRDGGWDGAQRGWRRPNGSARTRRLTLVTARTCPRKSARRRRRILTWSMEAVGRPETWEASVHLVRKGGTVNFFGGCPAGTSVTLDTTFIHYSDLTLLASFHHTPRAIRRALEFIEAGVIHAGDFVDGECPLTQLPELFKTMAAGNHAIKTLIKVHE